MEEKFNKLIVLLQAYMNACKDFHYFCDSFALHLLADEINSDDFYDLIDEIKENVFIAQGQKPLTGKEYATQIAEATPEVQDSNEDNLSQLYNLADEVEKTANSIKAKRRAENVILDSVAEKMAHAKTLLVIELEGYENIGESLKKEECEGQKQKPVDRKRYKIGKIDDDKVAKTVLDYEAQNLLVAEEESTLDKLSKKLGVE